MFCKECGKELEDNSKYCNNCGTAIVDKTEERKIVYEGNIHKCPNCGEVLKSFVANCPTCGNEIRNAKPTSSVQELSSKLEAIESNRENTKKSAIKNFYWGEILSKTDEQKISLIRSFIIPNTKEDLYEFLILSKSNIEIDLYQNTELKSARLAVSDAWKAKFEQAYHKAKLVFQNDDKMLEIQAMYEEINTSIHKAKWKLWKGVGLGFGIMIAIFIVIMIIVSIVNPMYEKNENERLEAIVIEIKIALENKEYKLALMNAESLKFDNGGISYVEAERKWEIQREYWIDKVINEAAENGVILEYTYTEEDDNANDESNDVSTNSGFIEGFNEGLHSNDEEIQKNIEEFKNILNSSKSSNN